MRNSSKKFTAFLLAGLMLVPLASCAAEGEKNRETESVTQAVTEAETTDPNYVCDLPSDLDYGKKTVTMLYPKNRKDELVSESLGKDGSISDAVYERNLAVESQLNVRLAFEDRDDHVAVRDTISTLVRSGDNSIELFSVGVYVCMEPVMSGCYLNLNEMEYLDLSKHYWNRDFNDMMTFTDAKLQFVATSPIALSLFRNGYLTIFNRDLFRDRGITDLYEAVDNGTWTLEYQGKLIADQWYDADGDGKKSEGDFYGFITDKLIRTDGYAVSSDIHLVEQDENGYMTYNGDQLDRFVLMAEKVSALHNSQGTYAFGSGGVMGKFAKKEGLMGTVMFAELETEIEALTEISYGIAPLPKLTVEQPAYHTYIQDGVSCYGISAAIADEEDRDMLGAVLESMAYHSYATVRPAYYDSALSLRFMQDPESRYILDMMFETFSFDYCYATGLAGIRDGMREVVSSPNPSIASNIKKWEKAMKNQLAKEKKSLDQLMNQS